MLNYDGTSSTSALENRQITPKKISMNLIKGKKAIKKIAYFVSALIVVMLTGCATTDGFKPYCQRETARFLRSNLDPGTIIIEDASTKQYSGNRSWYFWTAVMPNGRRYKCQAFSGDETRYCREVKLTTQKKSK